MNTKELIDRIFKEPGVKFELTEFENLGKPIHNILNIYPKAATTGKDAGKTKFYLKSFIPFSTGNEEVQVYAEGGKSAPEEIVRQLWVYKLMKQYGYQADEIELEKGVQFGTEIGTKAADVIVYSDSTKLTPKIIIECKKPKRKDGIEQLKSYMNAKGAPVAVWSNGADSIILYRPYPAQFDDTLFDIPKRGQAPKDVLEASKTLLQLKKDFNFKKIIQDLEELVLADSGKDEFNEIFKLIFAKIWDEKEALENRTNKVVEFRKAIDPEITYDRIKGGALTPTERDLFDELQGVMEGCSTQIGRKTEQLRLVEEDILALGKRIGDIEVEIEKLYEKHNVSKEKSDFIEECDAIASVLNQFIVRLRKNKVHLLQEKTFEMYRLLSSRSGLIKDITIDDKTYEVKITDRNGHEIRKSALSAGEKEVFAVSLLWGLAQTSELKLPIIIDTPLSRLDSTHRDNIVNNYFPNAGEQVIILSTDTEIDTNYYRALKPRLSGAASLEFDQRQELTTFRQGYFWEKSHGWPAVHIERGR